MTKMQEVLSEVPDADRTIVALHANLLLNTGGGRPSGAARRAVAEYRHLGPHEFRQMHSRDKLAALKACSCAACQRDAERLESRPGV